MHSPADFFIDRARIADTERLADLIDSMGLRTVVVYGYSHLPENTTDPRALPEGLYLRLGPATFAERVRLLDAAACRYACLPSFGTQELLETLAAGRPFLLVVPRDPWGKLFPFQGTRDFLAFERRYLSASDLVELPIGLAHFRAFLVATPRPPAIPRFGPVRTEGVAASPPPTGDALCMRPFSSIPFDWLNADPLLAPDARTEQALVVRGGDSMTLVDLPSPAAVLFGETFVAGERDERFTFVLVAGGNTIVEIDGEPLAQRILPGERGVAIIETLDLSPGSHSIRIYVTMRPASGHLRFALLGLVDRHPLPWRCVAESKP